MSNEITRITPTAPLRRPTGPIAPPQLAQAEGPKAPTDELKTSTPEKKEEGNAVQRFFGGLLGKAGDLGTKAVDWYEDTVTTVTTKMADSVKDVPVLGTVAKGLAWTQQQGAQLAGGVLKGAGTMVGGIANMIVHPVDTAKGLYSLAEHLPILPVNPLRVAHAAYDVTVEGKDARETFGKALDPIQMLKDDAEFGKALVKGVVEPYKESIDKGKVAEAVGRGIFDIGSIVLTAGGGAAVSGGTKGAQVANVAAKAGRGAEVANVAAKAGRGAEVANVAAKAGRGGEVANVASKAGRGAEVANAASKTGKAAEVANAGKAAEVAKAGKAAEVANAGKAGEVAQVGRNTGIWRIPGAKPTSIQEGIEVAVRRSSGVLDDGWRVEGKLPNGRVRVAKPGSGMYKDVPASELVKANPNLLEVPQGTKVAVRRSSGAIDDGWQVSERMPNGNYKVSKPQGGGVATKEVPPGDLLEHNPHLVDGTPPVKQLSAAERAAAGAEQGFDFLKSDRVKGGTPIKDGYIDGGGSMRKAADGSVKSSRELIVVDRARDPILRQQLEWAKSLRNAPEEVRLQQLMKYVDEVMSPNGNPGMRNFAQQATDAWGASRVGKEVLLGEVGQLGGGVCRHRSLLFKVLADEAGLTTDLVRGTLKFTGGQGRHAWNEVLINGRKVVVDIMNPTQAPGGAYKVHELAKAPYQYVMKDGTAYGGVTGRAGM